MKPICQLLCLSIMIISISVFAEEPETNTHRIEISPLLLGPPTHEYPSEEKMTEEKLSRILDNMKNDGFNTVLIVGGFGEKAYFPSKVLKDPTSKDWYAITFEMALERNMQVGLSGVAYTYHNQFTGGTWDPELDLEVNKKFFTELNQRYGHLSNFWGWYIPHETGDRIHRGDIMVILRELPRFLKKLTPDKQVSFSPWFPSRITLGEAEALSPAQTAAEWDTILCQVEGIDVYVFQDSTAPLDELTDYFAAVKPVFDKHGAELWATIELFIRFQDRPGIDLFQSISPEMLLNKLKILSPYATRFACWEYQTHLNPDAKTPGAKELNKAYNSWLNETVE